MKRRASALRSVVQIAAAKHSTLSPEQFVAEVYKRLAADDRRPIPYYRARELCPPLSKSYVYALLDSGELTAVRLNGLLLIEAESVTRWLAKAVPWEPR